MTSARNRILDRLKQASLSTLSNAETTAPHSNDAPVKHTSNSAQNSATTKPLDHLLAELETQCQLNHIELIHTEIDTWQDRLAELATQKKLKHWLLGQNRDRQIKAFKTLNSLASIDSVQRYEKNYETLKYTLFNKICAGLTEVSAVIAETGTLLIIPSTDEPRTLSLVPPVHVALAFHSQLVPTQADALSEINKRYPNQEMPSNILFISGPSKTADIQQTLAYGAHGPKELILLLIDDTACQ